VTTYVCPKCGFKTEQPALKGAEVTHACPKAKPFKKHIKLKEKK